MYILCYKLCAVLIVIIHLNYKLVLIHDLRSRLTWVTLIKFQTEVRVRADGEFDGETGADGVGYFALLGRGMSSPRVSGRGPVGKRMEGGMRLAIMSPIRLFREGLAACLGGREGLTEVTVVEDVAGLRAAVEASPDDLVALVDVTQGVDLDELRRLAGECPALRMVAVGLKEQGGRWCGTAGRVRRLRGARPVHRRAARGDPRRRRGASSMPAEIANGLLRALFGPAQSLAPAADDPALTGREGEVLRLLGRGMSNKEIARELGVSLATVKHHVHNLLGKMGLARRGQAMRKVREAPWIATSG
jgi:DNA-binding NarL/FixJ family response regulator